MKHDWHPFERGEWCKQCGTYRTDLFTDFNAQTGEEVGKVYLYYEVGQEPRRVPEREGACACPLFPRSYSSAIRRWLEIRENWGLSGVSADQLFCDMDHSALFRRLLAGKEVFPEPPPLSHSYPNYPLLEKGWGEPYEVWTAKSKGITCYGPNAIFIDQHRWEIVSTLGDDAWLVTYSIPDAEKIQANRYKGKTTNLSECTVRSKTRWHIFRVGSWIFFGKDGKSQPPNGESLGNKLWRIERMPDAEEQGPK